MIPLHRTVNSVIEIVVKYNLTLGYVADKDVFLQNPNKIIFVLILFSGVLLGFFEHVFLKCEE